MKKILLATISILALDQALHAAAAAAGHLQEDPNEPGAAQHLLAQPELAAVDLNPEPQPDPKLVAEYEKCTYEDLLLNLFNGLNEGDQPKWVSILSVLKDKHRDTWKDGNYEPKDVKLNKAFAKVFVDAVFNKSTGVLSLLKNNGVNPLVGYRGIIGGRELIRLIAREIFEDVNNIEKATEMVAIALDSWHVTSDELYKVIENSVSLKKIMQSKEDVLFKELGIEGKDEKIQKIREFKKLVEARKGILKDKNNTAAINAYSRAFNNFTKMNHYHGFADVRPAAAGAVMGGEYHGAAAAGDPYAGADHPR